MEAATFDPPGLIPTFNAWGNHPPDMIAYIRTHVTSAFQRLGIFERYQGAEKILLDTLQILTTRPSVFSGYYKPCPTTQRVLTDFLMANFIQPERCNFFGRENYAHALELCAQGKNVLVVQNHTSPLDALVPFTLIHREFPGACLPSVIMSQVFEYARITGIITAGVEKFPVFQPKHMRKFSYCYTTIKAMKNQNLLALRALRNYSSSGGKMIFLYPERDRNSSGMGIPEPKSMKILELLNSAGPELFILPTFICGLETIFPNKPGANELDEFFSLIQVGQGDFHCGEAVKFSEVKTTVASLDQTTFVSKVLESAPEKPDELYQSALAVTLLKMIANLAPNDEMKGIYA